MDLIKRRIEVGDIVQLDPQKTGNPAFAACFMVVTDLKEWGVQGYVQALGTRDGPGGIAYYLAENGTFEKPINGKAVWMFNEDLLTKEKVNDESNEVREN